MKHSVNILNELQEISPQVAELGCSNPYSVPAGYFSTLPDLILSRIRSEEEALPPVLQEAAGPTYSVPAGYFDQLAATILQRVKAEDDGLSAEEELSVLSPLLSGIGKKMPFGAPPGYFAGLEDNVVSGARALDAVNEELENLPAVLVGLQDMPTYQVSAGYFEQLPARVLEQVKPVATPAKVVSFPVRRFVRYAAAAVVAGVIAVGAWWYAGSSGVAPTDVANKVEKLSTDELQSYLETQSAPMPASDLLAVHNRPEIESGDLSGLLENVSDEEIQRYLEQNLLTQQTATN
ncbi:hypothetical protein [Paraflavitalea pollutisoli]|uniref:hypothetical protein n=1 Tax=Paraflavitalea pollutisoli TaxID=3034143 RepID=UPI0023EC0D22|nr:hypothetical protein [Paraflavitalea sp. H1-2-19X]